MLISAPRSFLVKAPFGAFTFCTDVDSPFSLNRGSGSLGDAIFLRRAIGKRNLIVL